MIADAGLDTFEISKYACRHRSPHEEWYLVGLKRGME